MPQPRAGLVVGSLRAAAESASMAPETLRAVVAMLLAVGLGTSSAYAQDSSRPLIAILDPGSPTNVSQSAWNRVFKEALAELGWVDGRSVKFYTGYAENRVDRMA